MARTYLVTKDIPITFQVEAESPTEAITFIDDDCPKVYDAINKAVTHCNDNDTTNPVWCGDWYDDTNAEEFIAALDA